MNKPHLSVVHHRKALLTPCLSAPVRIIRYSGMVALALFVHLAIAPCARAGILPWDADPATSGPQDGNGNWDTNTAAWWNGSADVVWTNANGEIGRAHV